MNFDKKEIEKLNEDSKIRRMLAFTDEESDVFFEKSRKEGKIASEKIHKEKKSNAIILM